MKIKLLGAHNCETLDTRHAGLMIDSVLLLDAGSVTYALTAAEQVNIRAVLLSHQHYDHIRDIPALGVNLFHAKASTDIYSTSHVFDIIMKHFMTSGMYRNLAEIPPGNPVFRFNTIEPFQVFQTAGYKITAVPVKHSAPTIGYQVSSEDGKSMFYGADTGPGLAECWGKISPQMVIIEVTETDKTAEQCRKIGHLTPVLLKEELVSFRNIRGYLPRVVAVHMSPALEDEIKVELAEAAGELGCDIRCGYEGMEINL